MSKSEVIARINADHMAKIAYFQSQSPKRQHRLAQDRSFWSAHECSACTWEGVCLECGQTSLQLAV